MISRIPAPILWISTLSCEFMLKSPPVEQAFSLFSVTPTHNYLASPAVRRLAQTEKINVTATVQCVYQIQ